MPEIVPLTGTLAYTGKHAVSGLLFGNVVDELHDEHGLPYTGTTEEAGFSAARVRFKKINDLDAGLKHFRLGRQLVELRSGAVY